MHARFVLVVAAILGSHLTNATYHLRAALVTPAPRLNELNARQNLQCQHATETVCADGNGCCPFGQACTVYQGAPACVGTCAPNGPICPNKLCCDLGEKCVLSAGNYYCSDAVAVIPTFGPPEITKTIAHVTPFIITFATETFPTVTLPSETFSTETFPTATVTMSNAFTQSSGSSSASSSSSAAMTETFSTSSESAAVGSSSSAAVPPTTTIQSGEAAAVSEQWFGIVLTWFTGLLLIA